MGGPNSECLVLQLCLGNIPNNPPSSSKDCIGVKQGQALFYTRTVVQEGQLTTGNAKNAALRAVVQYGSQSLFAAAKSAIGFGCSPIENRRRGTALALLVTITSVLIPLLRRRRR